MPGRVIAVDFDGTLCERAWPGIGAAKWPVIDALRARQRQGDKIVLWTCRTERALQEALVWCLGNGLVFDAVNENVRERIEQYGDDPRKISADEYWDDKAVIVSGETIVHADFGVVVYRDERPRKTKRWWQLWRSE